MRALAPAGVAGSARAGARRTATLLPSCCSAAPALARNAAPSVAPRCVALQVRAPPRRPTRRPTRGRAAAARVGAETAAPACLCGTAAAPAVRRAPPRSTLRRRRATPAAALRAHRTASHLRTRRRSGGRCARNRLVQTNECLLVHTHTCALCCAAAR
jgi:hypothetical protein